MGERKMMVEALGKILGGWDFLAYYANGAFGGLIIGWKNNIHLLNSSFLATGICTYIII
jgi:hypothetical protein